MNMIEVIASPVGCPHGKGNCTSCSYFGGIVGTKVQCTADTEIKVNEKMRKRLVNFINELKVINHEVSPSYVIAKLYSCMD